MDIDNVFGTIVLVIFLFRIFMTVLIVIRARKKGLSGFGYFMLSLFVSSIIAIIALSSSKPTGPGPSSVINLRLKDSSFLRGETYRSDADKHGDWMVKPHKGADWIVVTGKRAYQFLLDSLGEDGRTELRTRLIEARQGKTLEE